MPPRRAVILVEHDMKFNRRLFGYIVIYVGGSVYLAFHSGNIITATLFGLITIVGIIATPTPIASDTHPTTASDLRMAKGVQEAIMDLPIPDIAGLKISRFYLAASWVGGDFTFFHSRDNTRFAPADSGITGVVKLMNQQETFLSISIGDVAGHGVSSALIMALTTGLFSEVAQSVIHPADVLSKVNSHLASHISQSDIRYVTCMYLTIYPKSRRLQYCRAGHPPAFIVRQNGECVDLDAAGVFLGMYEDENYTNTELPLYPGDRIALYSDGITEVRNPTRDEFGIDRLKELIVTTRTLPSETVLSQLKEQVSVFGPLTDDQTVVLVDIT